MKKLGLLVLIISMFVNVSVINVNAEEVSGLSEKLGELIMENNFTQEQFKEMDRQYIEQFDQWFWNEYLEPTKELGKMHMPTDEEEYEYCLNKSRPNYSRGLLVTPLKSKKYAQQYSSDSVFSYLFYNSESCWVTTHNNGLGVAAVFNKEGNRIFDYEQVTITQEMIDFIKEKRTLQNMLLQKGESCVDDIKIFCFNRLWTLMYIKCGNNEYGISLFYLNGANSLLAPNFDLYKIYNIADIISLQEEQNKDELGKYYKEPQTKPTYTTEAESLQADGLLNGNENGLDLLKPLTRIEATAMLVRAMGYESDQTSDVSYFSDIQSDNWGARYANIAKDKGITAGVGDNMFAPDELITSNQFATLILRNTGENPDWQTAINEFIDRGIITADQAGKMDLFTRGDMAKIIFEAKQKGLL